MPSLMEQFEETISALAPRVFTPVRGARISQGVRPLHRAIDFAAPIGTPVVAPVRGVITSVQDLRTGYGRNIRLDIGGGEELVFAHLGDVLVEVGQRVMAGLQLGTIGMTGSTDAPHLHYEQRKAGRDIFSGAWSTTTAVDPFELLRGSVEPDVSGMRIGTPPAIMKLGDLLSSKLAAPVSIPTLRSVSPPSIFGTPFISGEQVIEEAEQPEGDLGLAGKAASEVVKVVGAPFYRLAVGGIGMILIIVGLVMLSSALRQNAIALVKEGVPIAIGAATAGPAGAAAGAIT